MVNGESWSDVIFNTLSESDMAVEFDDDYGNVEGSPFAVWSTGFIYFPVKYDGAEWVESVSRNPNGKPIPHIGGG